MRVTVLMTLYNKGPYVEEAVRSVLAQTFTDFELLVVDDASTDDGPDKVKAIPDQRIKLVQSDRNQGRPAAANRGYDVAKGDYVAVLDADDLMHPERLEKQVAYMDAHPEVGALGSWTQFIGGSSYVLPMPENDPAIRGLMLFAMPVLYPASMLRRSTLEEHHLRCDEQWLHPGMDRLFMLSIGRHTRYANLQEVLSYYRTGDHNMRHGRDAVADMIILYRELFSRFGIPGDEREMALQTFLHDNLNGPPPNALEVWQLGNWVRKLIRWNRGTRAFPIPEFEAELNRRWDNLFHRVVQHNAPAALVHMGMTGQLVKRAGYWAKVAKDRLTGSPAPHR